MPPDRHPEPGFRWARAIKLRVRLTRDDHATLIIYQARARGALVQGNIKPGRHRRHFHCKSIERAWPTMSLLANQGAKFRLDSAVSSFSTRNASRFSAT